MLKPIVTAACLGAAALAAARPCYAQSQQGQFQQGQGHAPAGLSGAQIGELVAGATVEVETPAGTTMPVSYGRDGRLSGEARGLAWYLGAATDTGRWWVAADQLCHRWSRWFNAEPRCIWVSRRGRTLHWQSADGGVGTARITHQAVAEATEAAPQLQRQADREPPAQSQPAAQPPAAQPPTVPLPVPVAPRAAAAPAAQPAARALPHAGTGPSPRADQPPPAHPGAAPPARFKVANVRADDVLNVRSGPSADHAIVGEIAPGSRGIAITSECRARWCPVQHNATAGWVNAAYLAPEILPAALHGPLDLPPGPARDSPEAPRSCLTPAARSLLDRIERNFGPVQVISTCRPGALIAGTARPSRHASGNAVDFKAGPRKATILEWLIVNHHAGGVMTYARMDHIHVDIGPRFVSLARRVQLSSWRDGGGH